MKTRYASTLVLGALLPFSGSALALTVTATNDGNLLASTILGSGITISNVSYTGTAASAGTFTGGSVIGMESGIILTSGAAVNAQGPNTNDASTANNGLAGDANLNSLIPGFTTNDATILEFDFESAGGDVFFNYSFGSEEYNEWVGSAFNDVFGFFLDGTNIALLPGTTTPVSINNVNLTTNSSCYNNNDPSNGIPTPHDVGYDGFTCLLTASATGLTAGTHHIKLAIADAGDFILDSGVFIQAGSFSDTPTDVPEPATLGLFGLGLLGMGLARRRKNA